MAHATIYPRPTLGPTAFWWFTALAALPVFVFSAVYLAVGRGEPVRAAVAGSLAAAVAFLPLIAWGVALHVA